MSENILTTKSDYSRHHYPGGYVKNKEKTGFLLSLSTIQINCLCMGLLQIKNYKKLEELLTIHPNISQLEGIEVYRAKIHLANKGGDLNQVFQLIESTNYPEYYWDELQEIWFTARCKEYLLLKRKKAEKRKAKHSQSLQKISLCSIKNLGKIKNKLESVDRYRIKKRFPYPLTIWDGDKVKYNLKESTRKILYKYFEHTKRPDSKIKRQISEATRLTIKQITNWFKNRNQRERSKNKKDKESL